METPMEKVYVALGSDLQDGFKTLQWTLERWKSNHNLSLVILHVAYNISKDFVYTPYGKLPASSISDEKLEVIKNFEEQEMDKLLSKYTAFCGKVKAEIQKIENSDDTIDKVIVDLIVNRKITKFVMSITFLKSSSWRSKSVISGSFYIHSHKPSFCEFYIICGGKLVSLNGKNEELTEDYHKVEKGNHRNWIARWMFANDMKAPSEDCSPRDLDAVNQWDACVSQIDEYFQHLQRLNLEQDLCEFDNDTSQINQSDFPSRVEEITSKIEEAQKKINMKRSEAKVSAERYAKAEWAMGLCANRVKELEAKTKEEANHTAEIIRNLASDREQMQEIRSNLEESKSRLTSLLELQSELSSKLQKSSLERSNAEKQLEKAEVARADIVREIEELRKQRDILQRRIEFCKEKDAIGMASKFDESTCRYREYTAEDIKLATANFSANLKLKSVDEQTVMYRGRLDHVTVVIMMVDLDNGTLLSKAKLLTSIRHPHLVALIGYCLELKCMIFEYMHNGSLQDMLLARQATLRWHDRIRIAHEVCLGLAFIHSAQPKPMVHGHLTPSNVFLNRNLVAKINAYHLSPSHKVGQDIRAFGMLLIHLLTGRDWTGLVEAQGIVRFLDEKAGPWPVGLAEEMAGLAVKCATESDMNVAKMMNEMGKIKKNADAVGVEVRREMVGNGVGVGDDEDSINVPRVFLCPILQEVMKNPHVAADGFSYELEAMEEWLRMGRDTSPMTNLRLNHKFLTPNNTLRSLIQDWLHSNSSPTFSS